MIKIRSDRLKIKNQWVGQTFGSLFVAVVMVTLPWTAQAQTALSGSLFRPLGYLLNKETPSIWADSVASAEGVRAAVRILSAVIAPPADILNAIKCGKADFSLFSNDVFKKPSRLNAVVKFASQSKNAAITSLTDQSRVSRHWALADELDDVQLLGVMTHRPDAVLLNEAGVKGEKTPPGLMLHTKGLGVYGVVQALETIQVVAPCLVTAGLLVEGNVQGLATPLDSFISFSLTSRVCEVVVMPSGFYNAGLGLMANRQKGKALNEHDKAAIEKISGEVLARSAGRLWNTSDVNAFQKMRAMGILVTDIDVDLLKKIERHSELRQKTWVTSVRTMFAGAETVPLG